MYSKDEQNINTEVSSRTRALCRILQNIRNFYWTVQKKSYNTWKHYYLVIEICIKCGDNTIDDALTKKNYFSYWVVKSKKLVRVYLYLLGCHCVSFLNQLKDRFDLPTDNINEFENFKCVYSAWILPGSDNRLTTIGVMDSYVRDTFLLSRN